MKSILTTVSAVVLSIGFVSAAQATVIGGAVTGGGAFAQGGIFVKETVPLSNPLPPANSVGDDTYQDPNLRAFDEEQNILIAGTIQVDVGTNPQMGDEVASHYVYFDPNGLTSVQGYVDFDADIFGVATSMANMAASDFLANTGVNYLNPGLRGLEAGDSATIDPMNPRRLLVNYVAATPGDYVRVFTKRSPIAASEPAILALMGFGIAGLGLAAHRTRKYGAETQR